MSTLPTEAPAGHAFFLVSNPTGKKKYFVDAPRGGKSSRPKQIASFVKGQAKTFTNRTIAESFHKFLNDIHIFPGGESFHLVMEPHGAAYASGAPRIQLLAE